MAKIDNLIELLGEENTQNLKQGIVNIILDTVRYDLEYDRKFYLLDPDEIQEFINECKDTACKELKDELIEKIKEKIKISIDFQDIT